MKTYTTKEIRKLTVDEFITGIDVTTLTNDVRAKYSDRYEEKFLSTANIISHILVFASCWISSLKMKTVTNYTPSSDDITVIFDTFEEYVLETICDSFEYDAAYSSKLHRLPSSKPLRTEAEASELYRLHKSEIDITAANIKNGGRTPISGIVHSVTLLLVVVFLMPLAKLIPMPCIAAILFQVAYNMSGWRNFVKLCKSSPKSDILVLATTFLLTVIFDLVVAIEVGIVLAAILFMKRMSDVTEVSGWKYIDDENDPESIELMAVPAHTCVYEISGPMFFAAAEKILNISIKEDTKVLVIRMRSVNAIDATAMRNLEQLVEDCEKKNVKVVLSHVNEQPMKVMEKAGLVERVGKDNFCSHIEEALKRAEDIQRK